MPLGCSEVPTTMAWATSRERREGEFWGRLRLEVPTFPGLKEPPCSQGFHDGAPGPATPAATSHSPLKATIDMADATRLGSEAGGSPRSKFHTFFWVSVSQLWAVG